MILEIQDTEGNQVDLIQVGRIQEGITSIGSFKIINGDETNENGTIHLSAGLFRLSSVGTNQNGMELVAEKWLEISIASGEWTPLGAINSENTVEIVLESTPWTFIAFQLRLNVAGNSSSFGKIVAAFEATFH